MPKASPNTVPPMGWRTTASPVTMQAAQLREVAVPPGGEAGSRIKSVVVAA